MEHIIELPEKGFFKVVQIFVGEMPDGLPHLPFDYIGYYHRDILKKFLKGKNIPFETRKLMGNDLPLLKGEGYEVVGMGELVRKDNKISFSSNSMDYGLRINPKHIDDCKPYFKIRDLEIIVK